MSVSEVQSSRQSLENVVADRNLENSVKELKLSIIKENQVANVGKSSASLSE